MYEVRGDAVIDSACEDIIKSVKNSYLNYSEKVMPYSMYKTVRKSLISLANPSKSGSFSTVSPLNTTRRELKIKIEEFEKKAE